MMIMIVVLKITRCSRSKETLDFKLHEEGQFYRERKISLRITSKPCPNISRNNSELNNKSQYNRPKPTIKTISLITLTIQPSPIPIPSISPNYRVIFTVPSFSVFSGNYSVVASPLISHLQISTPKRN